MVFKMNRYFKVNFKVEILEVVLYRDEGDEFNNKNKNLVAYLYRYVMLFVNQLLITIHVQIL